VRDRRARRPPRLRGALGPDERERRDGRSGNEVASRARPGGRNYDDRYAWIRDQCYAGHAGGRRPDEHRLPLPDYPGGTALAGNRVNAQFQLDALGAALLLFAAASARPATPTASAPTSARSATPTARSCCAGS
jgi:hypothetical protein